MQRAPVTHFAHTRNDRAWRSRGLLALYGFGVASLIAAVVTFIAHNWTYLGTGAKLGGLGVALVICAAIWIIRGFDRQSAQSFGIAAQVLIGVWLAAAGQIYQAPGGLQDLLLIWAVLGLPFALASRSGAHWAVWFSVIWLAAISETGLRLMAIIGPDLRAMVMLAGAVILSVGFIAAQRYRAPLWLRVILSVGIGMLCISASWMGLFDSGWLGGYGPSLLGLIALAAVGRSAYARQTVSTSAVLAAAAMFIIVTVVGHMIAEAMNDGVTLAFIMTGIVGGATYVMVLIFKHLRTFIAADPSVPSTETEIPWYMDAFIAVGGVVTAIFASALIGTIIGLSGLMEANWELSCLIIGAIIYGAAIWMRRKQSGQFLRFLFGTFILAGIGCSAFGVGAIARDTVPAGLALLGLSVLTAWLIDDDRILSALMAVAACVAMVLIMSDWPDHGFIVSLLMTLYTAAGLLFGTMIWRGKVRLGLAAVFFIAAIMAGLSMSYGWFHSGDVNWMMVHTVEAVIALVGGAWLWLSYGRGIGPSLPVMGALIVIAIILPIGAVPAMLLLLLAYMIGSRALFLIGILAMVWFLFSAYFDLSVTLMVLSAIMAVVGVGLLGLWAFARRRVEALS